MQTQQNPVAVGASTNPELDRRRMIYKNVRKEINEAEKLEKQKTYAEKMNALEVKARQKEAQRSEQQARSAQEAAEADRRRKDAQDKKQDFLSNLEAFNVD